MAKKIDKDALDQLLAGVGITGQLAATFHEVNGTAGDNASASLQKSSEMPRPRGSGASEEEMPKVSPDF